MVALGPPWTFAGVAGVDSRDLEYHHDSSPSSYFVQDDWYPLRSVQEAGFFHRPMYFVHGDDAQYVLCWSLSNGDTKNYIWCIDWDLKCEPILKLYQEFPNDESSWLKAGQYLFYPQPGSRGVWKAALKPNNLFSPFYVQVKLYSDFQPDWFKFGNDILIADSILPAAIQSPIQAQTDSTYCTASDYNSSSPDLSCIDPAGMSFGYISTPSSGNSDTSSDACVDISSPEVSGAEKPTWRGRFFFTNASGEAMLILPNHLGSTKEVKTFVANALSSGEIEKSVRKVKCSLCKNKKALKKWEVKPSNLERHIFTHFHIKCYRCFFPGCSIEFTTKDQWNKHMKKHPGQPPSARGNHQGVRDRGATSRLMQDVYVTFPPVVTDLPAGKIGLRVPNIATQAMHAQTLIRIDDD